MKIGYWYPLVQSLRAFVAAREEFEGISVYIGAKGSARKYPAIEICWDAENGLDVYRPCKGSISLWVDTYIKSDGKEAADAYAAMYGWQQKIAAALAQWPDAVIEELGLALGLRIAGIVSDGDMYRPTYGSRMMVSIEWRGRQAG